MNASERWRNRYAQAGDKFLFGMEPNVYLRRQRDKFEAGQEVLCLADGEGRNSVWLARKGMQVTATELCKQAIDKARGLAEQNGVSPDFVCADMFAENFPPADWTGRFDWVVAVFIQFANPEQRRRQFEIIEQVTRAGGQLLLVGYTPRQLEYKTGGPPELDHLYTESVVRGHLAGWDIELNEYDEILDEGAAHSGRSAFMGVIARKPW